jgi:hypothetical protein
VNSNSCSNSAGFRQTWFIKKRKEKRKRERERRQVGMKKNK